MISTLHCEVKIDLEFHTKEFDEKYFKTILISGMFERLTTLVTTFH